MIGRAEFSKMCEFPLFEQAIDAIINSDVDALGTLLDTHPNLVTQRSACAHQATLLHYVATDGIATHNPQAPDHIMAIAALLLTAGADPNATAVLNGGGGGSTPLIGLITSTRLTPIGKRPDLIRLYCDYGDPDGIARDGRPLATAIATRALDEAHALAQRGALIDNVIVAAALQQVDLFASLMRDPFPAFTDQNGVRYGTDERIEEMALVTAAMVGSEAIVTYLAPELNVNARSPLTGSTALIEAARAGHHAIVAHLLAQGARTDLRDADGYTAYAWAQAQGHHAIARQLSGAD